MQSKEDLERFYETPDPWGYETNDADEFRKYEILRALKLYGPFERALDVGCGEGFITKDLPAKHIYGHDLSESAMARLPMNVTATTTPYGGFDLVVATGVLYQQYDAPTMIEMIERCASDIILTCHIKAWEINLELYGASVEEIYTIEFPYREFTEVLRIFRKIRA